MSGFRIGLGLGDGRRTGEAAAALPFAAFPALRAGIASGRALVSIIGDSTTYGLGAGASTGGWPIIGANAANPARYLRDALAAAGHAAIDGCAGFGDRAVGPVLAESGKYYTPAVTYGAGWGKSQPLPNPWSARLAVGNVRTQDGGGPITFDPGMAYDRIEVVYPTFPGNGAFTLDTGGAALATISQSSPAGTARQTIAKPPGAEPINLRHASGSFVFAQGLRVWNSAIAGVIQVETLGNAGWKTSDWAGIAPAIDSLGAHLFIVNLGINDQGATRPAADFKTDLKAVLARCKATGADVLPVIPHPGGDAASDVPAEYCVAIAEAASKVGVASPVDLYTLFGSRAASAGDYFDAVHLRPSGHARVGAAYAARVMGS